MKVRLTEPRFPACCGIETIDIRHRDGSPLDRVALELDAHSARDLAETILRILEKVPSDLIYE